MKVAISSDNHLDLNKVEPRWAMTQQAQYLIQEKIDVYVIAGDLFNRFDKTLEFARDLQAMVGTAVTIRFLAGNHEMGTGISYDELESPVDDLYFHNKTLDIGDARLIGNNSWYDYTFDEGRHDFDEVRRFKREFWYDRRIEQPITDPERLAINLEQMRQAIVAAKEDQRKIVVINHFAQEHEFIDQIPFRMERLDVLKAFLGSQAVGDLMLEQQVQAAVSGHLHLHVQALPLQETTFYNASVGYHTRRVKEWFSNDFMTEWANRLIVLDV
ncbi:putative phosphoesterase [Fructobacillus pseudoficulneus]|uniref:Putative phosphoesterase n=1 Tax=Fructobacillus pseudoficulneus TaxID=220714 RepID=A0A3F3GYH5_9LACO|nr:metallophosphoesterase [Fructobacillus pseudoficulneus]GAP03072.1 putative phosphoesterase [Fructobacillus pseudoficulneus]SEH41611.1 putative phosphoesterase [Fructobacillus pseudoficulneus]